MKVLYLLYSFTIGGTERLVVDVCNEMVKRNHEVHLYIVNDYYSEDLIHTLDSRVHVELQKRVVGGGDKLKTVWKLTNYIRDKKIDVIHCNALTTPELLVLHPVLFRKVKVIHTIHDVGQYKTLKKCNIAYRNRICDQFVAISESVKKDIIQYGAEPKKVKVIYNAIDTNKFSASTNKEFNYRQPIIGNVARIIPEKKGQDVLIDAIDIVRNQIPEIKCIFVGEADEAHRKSAESLVNLVNQRKMENNVSFVGNVMNVSSFLKTVDIFVLPSRFEGFGISLIEAMAMGIPCIASNLDGPAELLGASERGLLVPAGDSRTLADAILNVANNYSEFKIKANRNVEYIRNNFSIDIMCNRLEYIYNN